MYCILKKRISETSSSELKKWPYGDGRGQDRDEIACMSIVWFS